MSKQNKINNPAPTGPSAGGFDPNSVADKNMGIFGLPFSIEDAEVVVLPVPWDATVSYSAGTSKGPQAIFEASFQIDLYDPKIKDAWKLGIAMDEIPKELIRKNNALRKKSAQYISNLEKGKSSDLPVMKKIRSEINAASVEVNKYVKRKSLSFLNKNKLVALIGGEHSTPLGLMQALAEKHSSFAILQIDAHADLRDAYEGFEFSHASIMFNALKIPQVKKLVQVGIRDYCEEEANIIHNSKGRVKTFFDKDIKHQQYEGKTWGAIVNEIVNELSDNVYISFDIDGLDPKLCLHTGTPVAGGFEFEQAVYLIEKVAESGRKIISFDINEVAPGADEWDANVGARLLYKMANVMAQSNGRIR